jgi:hypothetical protein
MKHLKKFNESAPVYSAQSGFERSDEYAEAYKKMQDLISELEPKFYEWCEENGHEGAEGSTDYDMTFNNILMELISRY